MPDSEDKDTKSQDDPNKGADDGNSSDDGNSDDDALKLEDVVEVEKDDLTDEQTTFLEDNKADLTSEQAEKYGIEVEKKDDDIIDADDVEVKTDGETKKGTKKEDGKDDDKDDDDDLVDEDDKKAIGKVVDKRFKEHEEGREADREEVRKLRNETKVTNFIATHPEFAKYSKVILKYKNHEDYANVPIEGIVKIVASDDLEKIGAEKERKATKKAKETQGGGDATRKPSGSKVDWATAKPEEVEAEKARIAERRA